MVLIHSFNNTDDVQCNAEDGKGKHERQSDLLRNADLQVFEHPERQGHY